MKTKKAETHIGLVQHRGRPDKWTMFQLTEFLTEFGSNVVVKITVELIDED